MKKTIIISIFLVSAVFPSFAEEQDFNFIVPEHEQKDWEQISLEVLVHEIEEDASALGLQDFKVLAEDSSISIIYRDLLFPPDSPEITDETLNKIQRLALVIERFANKIILVEGHSAKVAGAADDGTELSLNRARAVTGELAATGIFSEDRMRAYGFGEYQPVAGNETEEGRIQNRRVEISITDHFADDADYKISDPAVWWRTLSDIEQPGYMVFLFDNEKTSAGELTTILLENGFSYARAYDTEEGVALVYPDVTYDEENTYPDDWSLQSLDFLLEKLPVDDTTQVRIGGRGGEFTGEEAAEARYNTGLYIASSQTLLPESTLIGDEPWAYDICSDGRGGDETVDFIDAMDFSIVETNPIARYREFSNMGIGAGFGLRFGIPSAANTAWEPLRLVLGLNGLYHIGDNTSSVESLWEGEWRFEAGYRIDLTDIIAFTPFLGYGGTVHVLTDTTQSGVIRSGEVFYSQTASFKTDFEIMPEKWVLDDGTGIGIFIQPWYRIFFDQDYLGHSVNAAAGIRFDF
ncbi:MAG: OmpA family protein [Spirochaetales bacterium]|uniref:OmpA family protein n=1 Tax=Candidatus Thalassospirochaeta sargassi TaxID=3119039 RepID=A0AAJ1MMD8_9SPIO|nr:OmpA family protein [Spirochaetales bacterium]